MEMVEALSYGLLDLKSERTSECSVIGLYSVSPAFSSFCLPMELGSSSPIFIGRNAPKFDA
jgi:hypothetical protein